MGNLKIGLATYTNLSSGIGVFGWELWKYLGCDSILSVSASIKGQQKWSERQLTSKRPPNRTAIEQYFDKFDPDVVLFLETPFSHELFDVAHERGKKVVGIPMHETFSAKRLGRSDLIICVNSEAWRKHKQNNKKALFLPIGLKLFKFKERLGHTFVTNIGYGGVNDRRQSVHILRAFERVRYSNARLIMRCQCELPFSKKLRTSDERITFIKKNYPHPSDIYKEGDISILPIAYGGYERTILESMASGMPCLTTNAVPMNMYQHDKDFLVDPSKIYKITQNWVVDTYYNEVSIESLRKKMEWLLKLDTPKYSHRARLQAEAQSWECKDIDYQGEWIRTLEDLCS